MNKTYTPLVLCCVSCQNKHKHIIFITAHTHDSTPLENENNKKSKVGNTYKKEKKKEKKYSKNESNDTIIAGILYVHDNIQHNVHVFRRSNTQRIIYIYNTLWQ